MEKDKLEAFIDDALSLPAPEDDASTPLAGAAFDPQMGMKYAEDVFWALEHADEKITKAKAGSGTRYKLWQLAKSDFETFVTKVLPRACTILDKSKGDNEDELDIQQQEKKELREMRALLKRAIVEATGE